jgi:hypothetical protein
VRHSNVSNAASFFQSAKGLQVCAPVHKVVNLQEVDLVRVQLSKRFLNLSEAFFLSACPDLCCKKIVRLSRGKERADRGFRFSVHWRRVDDAPARFVKKIYHFAQILIRQAVKCLPGPESQGRNMFAARNASFEQPV